MIYSLKKKETSLQMQRVELDKTLDDKYLLGWVRVREEAAGGRARRVQEFLNPDPDTDSVG